MEWIKFIDKIVFQKFRRIGKVPLENVGKLMNQNVNHIGIF